MQQEVKLMSNSIERSTIEMEVPFFQVPNNLDIKSVSKEYIELLQELAIRDTNSAGTKRILYELSEQMWTIQNFLQKGSLKVDTTIYEN